MGVIHAHVILVPCNIKIVLVLIHIIKKPTKFFIRYSNIITDSVYNVFLSGYTRIKEPDLNGQ